MLLRKLASIIYCKGTASETLPITIKTYSDGSTLWHGIAKDLKQFTKENPNWIVVEVRIDHTDTINLYNWNKGKIITVI